MKVNWTHLIFTAFTAMVAAIALLELGFNYIYHGYGLNPYIAFPLVAVICVLWITLIYCTYIRPVIEDCDPGVQLPDDVLCNGPDYYVAPKHCQHGGQRDSLCECAQQ